MDRRTLAGLLAAALVAGAAGSAVAQADAYPQRPVTIVVPFPAGSATDAVARKLGEGLQRRFGQTFLIDNKTGADGIIAARHVAGAAPDAHTLMVTTNTTHSGNPAIYRELPYDQRKDFAPVAGIIRIPFILTTRLDLPGDGFEGFVRTARAANPPLSFGVGSTGSLASGELLKARMGFDMLQIPYRGSPQALTDLVGGRLDVFFADPASALGLIPEKRFKVLAVTGPKRVPSLPDVPTMSELGVPDYSIVAWVGAFAPARTPPAIVDRLNRAINDLQREADMIAFVDRIGSEMHTTTPAELGAFAEEDARRWVELVRIAKIEQK